VEVCEGSLRVGINNICPSKCKEIINDSTSKTYFSKLSQAFLEPHFTLYGYDIGFSEAFYQF